MKAKHKVPPRRRNYKWKPEEIEWLAKWGLLEFLPDRTPVEDSQITKAQTRRFLAKLGKELTPAASAKIGPELRRLKRTKLTGEELDKRIGEAAGRVAPLSKNINDFSCTYSYLRASLNLHPYPKRPLTRAFPKDPWGIRRRHLENKAQQLCFLEWTEIYSDVWTSPAWRECMSMRYGSRLRKAIAFLSRPCRRLLDGEAKRLQREVGSNKIRETHLSEGAWTVGLEGYIGLAHHTLRMDYLRATIDGTLVPEHPLNKPLTESLYFEQVALADAKRRASSEQTQSPYVERFCRYLRVPKGHADELTGQILYHMLQLQEGLVDNPQASLPEIPGLKWPITLQPEVFRPSEDFALLSDRFVAALEIDRRVFSEIWQAYVTLMLRGFWQQRAHVPLSVFWASRLLEGMRGDVCRVYGLWIDHFHTKIFRPLMRASKQGEADSSLRRAALIPFMEAVQNDPLFNCVFHSEVFGGHNRIFRATVGKRDEERRRSLIITYAVHRLQRARGSTPAQRVTEVLDDSITLQNHVRAATRTTGGGARIKGFSHYAYVAPLMAALFDDPHTVITADSVKDTFHNHKDDPEVAQLLSSLDHLASEATRG